jgi:hypothetical protein
MADLQALARRKAQKYGLDPNVFVRQIRQESGFNPHARSPAGAIGVAQIMPATARGWGVNPNDPAAALDAAAKHMAGYVRQFGSYRNALVAYNAGPGAVGRSLPAETRNYIKVILGGSSGQTAPRGGSSLPAPVAGTRTKTIIPGATIRTTIPTVDQPGFEQARRTALIGQMIARRNPNSFLLRSGLLNTLEPSLGDFTGARTITDRIPGATVTSPGAQATTASGRSLPPVGRGAVKIAPGADRAGVSIQPIVKQFVGDVAGRARRPITVGTGTNHNRLTVDGNVSDHWDGHAADLPQPVDSHQGDMVAAHALQVAGVPWSQAVRMAQRGGLYTLHPTHGQWKGRRVQVIWKTNQGGNHHNHVHVGIR